MSGIVFVEGDSDREALTSLAARLGRDLADEGVSIVPMGGASAIGEFLDNHLTDSLRSGAALGGLCDHAEVPRFVQALGRAGLGVDLSVPEMESLGFYVCVRDLEDELILSLGPETVQQVIAEQGESRSFRRFQNQPPWRGRPIQDQVRRFIGTRSGRKLRYGREMVEALDLSRVPRPLAGVLAHIGQGRAQEGV